MSEAAILPNAEPEATSRLRSAGIFAGYGLFFLLALMVSLVLTFPNRQLKGFVESQGRKAGYPVAIADMALTGLGGVSLEGVSVTLPEPKGKDGKVKNPGAKPTVMHLDALNASVALWPLIMRQEVDAKFSFEVGDGGIEDGHIVVRKGKVLADARGGKRSKKKKGKKSKKGPAKKGKRGRTATLIDLDIPSIDNLDLRKLGISKRALGFTDKVGGELRGSLSGAVSLHWEGTHEGARGDIDLELTDAVLHNPSVGIDAKGPPLALKDLRLGVVTVKVRIDEKGRINLLKSKRGVDSSTAIHLAGVDIFGTDLEMVAEERGHVIIPPGRSGMRQARMQVHLVFALPKAKKKTKKKADPQASRASWDLVRDMMKGKFKRYMRAGYLGMTCSGSLTRPICKPSLPQVTVGTRKRARTEARAKAKKDGKGKAAAKRKAELAKKEIAAKKAAAEASKKKKAAEAAKKKPTFKPVVRPGAKTKPTARKADNGAVKVKQNNAKKKKDDDEDEDDEDEDEDEDEKGEDDEEGDDDDEDDEDGDKKKKKKKKADKKAKKKSKDKGDDEDEDDEDGDEPE